MKIIELLEDKSEDLSTKLSAVVNQIAGRVIDTGSKTPMSLTSMINILSKMGINVSEQQFRDMVANPPLNNIIANVEGDNITFIGQRKDTSSTIKPDQTTATLEKMAKRASDKRT